MIWKYLNITTQLKPVNSYVLKKEAHFEASF